jgi:hypothetical protein
VVAPHQFLWRRFRVILGNVDRFGFNRNLARRLWQLRAVDRRTFFRRLTINIA